MSSQYIISGHNTFLPHPSCSSLNDHLISPNPSSRSVALGSTQHLTEMSTKNLLGGKDAADA
jgi:hypothetical protein